MELNHVKLFEDFVQDLQEQEVLAEQAAADAELNEEHLEKRADQEAFIIKNSDKKAEDLKDLDDAEVKKLYSGLEESVKEAAEALAAEEEAKLVAEAEEAKKKEEEDAKKTGDDDDDDSKKDGKEESAKDKMAKVRAAKKD